MLDSNINQAVSEKFTVLHGKQDFLKNQVEFKVFQEDRIYLFTSHQIQNADHARSSNTSRLSFDVRILQSPEKII